MCPLLIARCYNIHTLLNLHMFDPPPQEMFEKVNKAYEFLCTKSARILDGPDPENIILILKTQSILFNRHKQGVCRHGNMPKHPIRG